MHRIGATALVPLLLLAACPLHAASYDDQLARLTRGLPPPVRAFIDRRANCNHWSGEEPYDAARRDQILAALHRLRCDRLVRDASSLRRHYGARRDVSRALRISAEWSPG